MSRLDIHLHSCHLGLFQSTKILGEFKLTLHQGKIHGLLGRNGAGKSTLMKLIFGSLKAKAEAYHDGERIHLRNRNRHQLVGYLPQDPFLMRSPKVTDVVQMWFPAVEKQDKVLYEPLIHKIHSTRVGQLSVGERRFLEFLLVIYLDKPFLLLDEPFSMLSPLQIERVHAILQQQKQHKGIMISDHYYEEILNAADQSYMLRNGVILPVSNQKEVINFYRS
ncbi:ATP-binding cassette domain-containing protein [Nonlabens xiamenensis]|uniref:ATP-binding cassette domain-containing protein n=1 Tax=Nonlabens xiamenensis TaxID=2341043 RepID=UPI000F613C07|nr:ATP-binding cassette domain-containing protein [Nonlabens xiamenensis]